MGWKLREDKYGEKIIVLTVRRSEYGIVGEDGSRDVMIRKYNIYNIQ